MKSSLPWIIRGPILQHAGRSGPRRIHILRVKQRKHDIKQDAVHRALTIPVHDHQISNQRPAIFPFAISSPYCFTTAMMACCASNRNGIPSEID
ncbi:hypothetical protein M404DRAFT_761868 [Pisolithus tinctorius Marx 270]|uniref:Uncharacterized protein n=1 Tax=Pisolithus tinctorius Marx 270 TaxID=870435 RepID=A0A0C3NYK8_PISTI|nr:hypothetical protein M404DRAFT_761868 [Pisolithus tinctorius Marx 270]